MFAQKTKPAIGRAPEDLSLPERFQLAGKWIALELYTPTELKEKEGNVVVDLKTRRIRAIGDSPRDCIRQIEQAGLDPTGFEFTRINRPY